MQRPVAICVGVSVPNLIAILLLLSLCFMYNTIVSEAKASVERCC